MSTAYILKESINYSPANTVISLLLSLTAVASSATVFRFITIWLQI